MLIETNGIDLHWEVAGDGEPLLWLHGGMGCGHDWRFIFSDPPVGFQIVAPDLRGHGASTNPSGVFTFRQCAIDVLSLLAHLGLTKVKAIGLSGGGIVLLHMATIAPDALDSMVIVSAPTHFPEQARAIQRQFSEAAFSPAELERMRSRHRREGQIEQLIAVIRALAGDDTDVNFTPEILATIAARTLIVFGDRDPLYPVSIAVDLYRAIARSYLWVVPNGGHGPVFGEHAAPFRETALAFLGGRWS